MLDLASSLVPIDQVESETVALNINCPIPRDGNKVLGIRLATLERLCRFSGIKHLTIESKNTEDNVVAKITGVSSNGEAVGSVDTSAAAESEPIIDLEKPMVIPPIAAYIWARIHANINKKEVIERLSSEGKLNSIEAWAEALDQEMTKLIRDLGKQNLLRTDGADAFVLFATLISMGVFMNNEMKDFVFENPAFALLLTIWAIITGEKVMEGTNTMFGGLDNNHHDYRFSLLHVMGSEIDRYLLFSLLTVRLKLVEIIEL